MISPMIRKDSSTSPGEMISGTQPAVEAHVPSRSSRYAIVASKILESPNGAFMQTSGSCSFFQLLEGPSARRKMKPFQARLGHTGAGCACLDSQ
jgi:hypothetical protein